jgi:hypothetical protein
MAEAEVMRMPSDQLGLQLDLTFDLLGLFGVGRSDAAGFLADAELRKSVGALEATVWQVLTELNRELDSLALLMVLRDSLKGLLEEAKQDAVRIKLLDERGWLSGVQAKAAQATQVSVEIEASMVNVEIVEQQKLVAELAGLASWPGAYGSEVLGETSSRLDDLEASPDAHVLLRSHPNLRRFQLEYLVAEARLRQAAILAWPMIRLGPSVDWVEKMFAYGAMGGIEIPDGDRSESQVRAAYELRTRAKEALEAALAKTLLEQRTKREVLREATRSVNELTHGLDQSTQDSWIAGRALFKTDPKMLERWTMELERRSMALRRLTQQRQTQHRSAWSLREALGPTESTHTAFAGGAQ